MATKPKPTPKVIIDMEMPKRCGKCKLIMKMTSGKNLCLITRNTVDNEYRHATCPLTEYITQTNRRPTLLPCSSCGCKLREQHSSEINGKQQYWYSCKRCGYGNAQPQYGDTKIAARKAWNNLVK